MDNTLTVNEHFLLVCSDGSVHSIDGNMFFHNASSKYICINYEFDRGYVSQLNWSFVKLAYVFMLF